MDIIPAQVNLAEYIQQNKAIIIRTAVFMRVNNLSITQMHEVLQLMSHCPISYLAQD